MKEERFWLLFTKKLTGEASAEELELLQQMMGENPEWQTTFENLQELWESKPVAPSPATAQGDEDAYLLHISRLHEQAPEFSIEEYVPPVDDFIYTGLPWYRKRSFYAVAATVFVGLAALVWLNWPGTASSPAAGTKQLNEFSVSPGSRSKIQLPDGSQVWLNAGSKLTYAGSFTDKFREVELTGEAYFDVARDPRRPFIVHTAGIDVRVLGTSFNVKAYASDSTIETTLIHGMIEVVKKNQPDAVKVILKPLEKLVYNKFEDNVPPETVLSKNNSAPYPETIRHSSISIKPLNRHVADSNIVETSWVYNKLSFEDETFSDLALKMERWYNVKINITNDRLKYIRLSGSFVNETVEEALKELQLLVSFSYTIKDNDITLGKK